MIALTLADGTRLGTIDEADRQVLVAQLEEESSHDQDYFIDVTTIGILEEAGASAHLVGLLRAAVGATDGVDIAWREG
jgi:hypothetical protein